MLKSTDQLNYRIKQFIYFLGVERKYALRKFRKSYTFWCTLFIYVKHSLFPYLTFCGHQHEILKKFFKNINKHLSLFE